MNTPLNRSTKTALIGLVLIAAVLRWHGVFANTFHADEALFATWARLIAIWRDPLLATQAVDKPPLLFYVQAVFYPVVGSPAGYVARLPNFIASILLIPLTAQLTWRIYKSQLTTLVCAALITVSPLAIQFSGTAFTDPLLVFWLVTCAVSLSGVEARPGRAGLLFSLALATKYQAILFLPLLVGLGWLNGWQRPQWRRTLAGFLPILFTLILWEIARGGELLLWQNQLSNFGGLRVIWSDELWSRLSEWGGLAQYLVGSPLVLFALLLAMPPFFAMLIHEQDRPTAYDQLFILFLLGYFALHWLVAIPVWDRYLLPLLPVVALLIGRVASRVLQFTALPKSVTKFAPLALVTALVLVQLPESSQAYAGSYPIGGQPTADVGIAEMATLLENEPYGTVLYDHWYGWQLTYYLLDKGVFVKHFAHPAGLLDDLGHFYDNQHTRYLLLPNNDMAKPVIRTLTPHFTLTRHTQTNHLTLYTITR